MIPLKTSPLVGGVHVIAFAPASIVSSIDSSVGPPVAIIGNSGNSRRISLTIEAVFLAADTLKIVAPDLTSERSQQRPRLPASPQKEQD